jgi:hypothetical protein
MVSDCFFRLPSRETRGVLIEREENILAAVVVKAYAKKMAL